MIYMLADGNWLLWRAWSTKGQNTAYPKDRVPFLIMDWFCSYALRLQAQGGLLAFDGDDIFRYRLFKDYKKGRREGGHTSIVQKGPFEGQTVADAVYQLLKPTKKLFESVGIPVLQNPLYEADDVLASGGYRLSKRTGNHVYLVTRDKDLVQCVGERVSVYTPEMQQKPEIIYTVKSTPTLKYGLSPKQFLDYQILIGDAIDSVPPINGVTSRQALKLLKEHGSLSVFFKTPEGSKFYERNASELHRNKDLVGLSKKAFPIKGVDILFKGRLHGDLASQAFTTLRDAQTKRSLF